MIMTAYNNNDNNDEFTTYEYHVQVIETDASIRCGLKPFTIYQLIIETNRLQLMKNDYNNHTILFEWPYKYVRRYGYTSNSISFEAGSKCQTGEGLFIFRNKKSKILYNQITNNIDKIKRQQKSLLIVDEDVIVVDDDDDRRKSNLIEQKQEQIPHLIINDCPYAQVIKSDKKDSCFV